METLGFLADGFAIALRPENLMWSLVGVTVGTAVGVLPGIGPALTIALLLPLTYQVDAASAFMLFAGIYYGAMYGGSTTSILLNTPGETATIVTAIEGNKMARKGRAGAALSTAAIGSFVAGTIGTIGLTFLAAPVVDMALSSPRDRGGAVGVLDREHGQHTTEMIVTASPVRPYRASPRAISALSCGHTEPLW